MTEYYAITTMVVAASYFIVKKYLKQKLAIAICAVSYILLCLFPLMLQRLDFTQTLVVYAVVIGAVAVVLATKASSGQPEDHLQTVPVASLIGQLEDKTDVELQEAKNNYVTEEVSGHKQAEEIKIEEIKIDEISLDEVKLDETRSDEIKKEEVEKEELEQLPIKEINEDRHDDEDREEKAEEILLPADCIHTEIVRSFSEEQSYAPLHQDDEAASDENEAIQLEEITETEPEGVADNIVVDETEVDTEEEMVDETEVEIEEEMVDKTEQETAEETVDEAEAESEEETVDEAEVETEEEMVDETEAGTEEEIVGETEAETEEEMADETEVEIEEEVVDEPEAETEEVVDDEEERTVELSTELDEEQLSDKELITQGMAQSRQGNYNHAIRLMFKALKRQPEPALKYIIVSELSTLYQQVGMYHQAVQILAAYINYHELKGHSGIRAWREKLEFLTTLEEILKENKMANLPYGQVPDGLKQKAFAITLKRLNNK
ncbi:hypothetical protein [Desulfofalx alkaliphila]|uniref:hypothetical protein n=1 Tax=Desulfofalx alkaliphila TaxID=105483 RepID=UPI000689CE1C|nr:hypothetical protein [Desulfofalx alkaliphila]